MSQDPKQKPESSTSEDAEAEKKAGSSFFDTTMPGVDPESEAWKARMAPDSSKEAWRRDQTMTEGWQSEATMVDQPAVGDAPIEETRPAVDPAFQQQATLIDATAANEGAGTEGWEGADQVTMATRRAVDADQFQEQATLVGMDEGGGSADPKPVNPPPGSGRPASASPINIGDPTEGMAPVEARVLGDFRLDRKLGQGGMGEVYLATQLSLDRKVAVKLLPSSLVTQPKFIERFEREAKSAAKLSHPNIIQVYAFGIVDECPYFAMEYVEGEDLHERLLRAGRLPLSEIIEFMIGVGSALGAAGDEHLVHRDIKPSNIMIDRKTNSVKVMDFGLAKATSMAGASLTQSGLIMGTPNYMSPEQARGDEVDGRSDIYSLGIVFYELLTQQLPFRADTPAGLIFKHVYEQPEAPRVKNQDIPPFLEEVVLRMIEKDPEKRYAKAYDFVKDLKEFRNNQSYYLDGGERREDSGLTESSAVVEKPPAPAKTAEPIDPSTLATAPLQGPPTVVVNTGGGQASAWFRFFLIMLALGVLGFGITYFGHTQGSWDIPAYKHVDTWLEEAGLKKKRPDSNSNGGVGVITTGTITPTPTRTSVKFTYSRALPAGVSAQWNGFAEGGERFEPLNNGTYEVEPATYSVKYSKAGYQDLTFVVKVSKDGATVLESDQSINEIPLDFQPTAALAVAYQDGVKAIADGRFDEALAALAKAGALDKEYRAEGGASVTELITKAQDLKAKQAARESEGASVLAAAQKKAEAKDWKGALAELDKMPETSSKVKEGEALADSINRKLADWTTAISGAGAALRKGDLEAARGGLAAIVAEDPLQQTRARAELDRVLAAKALLAEAESEREAGFAAYAERDLDKGRSRLVAAQRAYEKYLKEYAGADAARRKDFEAVNAKLLEGKNLGEQISAMNKAYDSNKVETALDLANQILAKDPKNPEALEVRRLSIETLNDVKIAKMFKDFDRALAGEDPSAALAYIDRRASALYQRSVDELRAFAEVGRFTRSEHSYKLEDLKFDTLDRAKLTVVWRFEIRFPEVDRSVAAERVLKVSVALVEGSWKITEIGR